MVTAGLAASTGEEELMGTVGLEGSTATREGRADQLVLLKWSQRS